METLEWKLIREYIHYHPSRKRYMCELECKCGNKRNVRNFEWQKMLEGKYTYNIANCCKDCKLKYYWVNYPANDIYLNLYNSLKSSCKRKNRECSITFDEAISLYQSNCYYCKEEPSNTYKHANNKHLILKYNGIDRIDSSKGYSLDNVVPCCKYCNRAKNDLSQKDFYKLIERIYKFRVQRSSETSE